jgi:hypothetical protein
VEAESSIYTTFEKEAFAENWNTRKGQQVAKRRKGSSFVRKEKG